MHMKTESLPGRGGSAAPRRTFARSGGARPLGFPVLRLYSNQEQYESDTPQIAGCG